MGALCWYPPRASQKPGAVHGLLVLWIPGALHRSETNFPNRVCVADGLCPLLPGGVLPLGGELSTALAGNRGFVGEFRRPPDLRGHTVAARPQRRNRAGEQKSCGHRADFGPVANLRGLIPESGPVACCAIPPGSPVFKLSISLRSPDDFVGSDQQ